MPPPHECTHLNQVWPSVFSEGKKHKSKRGKINSYTGKVLDMRGGIHRLHFHSACSVPPRAPQPARFFLLCRSATRLFVRFNVDSPPRAAGAFRRVGQPVVMTLFGGNGTERAVTFTLTFLPSPMAMSTGPSRPRTPPPRRCEPRVDGLKLSGKKKGPLIHSELNISWI